MKIEHFKYIMEVYFCTLGVEKHQPTKTTYFQANPWKCFTIVSSTLTGTLMKIMNENSSSSPDWNNSSKQVLHTVYHFLANLSSSTFTKSYVAYRWQCKKIIIKSLNQPQYKTFIYVQGELDMNIWEISHLNIVGEYRSFFVGGISSLIHQYL